MKYLITVVKILLIIITLILVIGITILWYKGTRVRINDDEPLSRYEINNIKAIIEQYPTNSNIEYVTTKEIAINIAEAVLGKEEAKQYRPYIAKYDNNTRVWLVKGTTYSSSWERFFGVKAAQGGGPYILIQRRDGKILAIWYNK